MDVCKEEHHSHKVSLGEARETALTGGGWGGEPRVLGIFYRLVVQATLLYGLETWVLLVSMAKMVEGTHTEFLRLVTGKQARQLGDGTWETPWEEGVQEATETQSGRIYIEKR